MATDASAQVAGELAGVATGEALSYDRFGGLMAILAGALGFLYSVAFVVIRPGSHDLGVFLSSLFQVLGGIAATAAIVAVYSRVRQTEASFAFWGTLLAVIAAIGSVVHGGYDLANSINKPTETNLDLPSQIDPRGMLTFGLAGIGLFVLAWLMARNGTFPKSLAYLGYALAALLVIVYLGRLIVLDANSLAILVPAALTGFIANPVWYIWLGLTLWKKP